MVQLKVKPLKGEQFEIEYDAETATVEDLKAKIAELKSEYPKDLQKLIYSGRILENEKPVKDYSIKDSEFVVVMLTKVKAPAAAAPAAAAPAAAAPPSTTAPAAGVAGAAAAPVSTDTAAANLVSGSSLEPTIQQLCDMGFERANVERCLQAAFNNPDRAVEYLMSGIPDSVQAALAAAPGAAAAPATGAGAPGAPAQTTPAAEGGAGAEGGDAGLAMLRGIADDPDFQQVVQLLSTNPDVLPMLLPHLQRTHPGLVQAIRDNPQVFEQMLMGAAGAPPASGGADDAEGGADPVTAMLAAAQAGAAGGGGMPGQQPAQPPQAVQLSPEEVAAVQRLSELGFDRNMAAQAYFAAEKNEELAANMLLNGLDADPN